MPFQMPVLPAALERWVTGDSVGAEKSACSTIYRFARSHYNIFLCHNRVFSNLSVFLIMGTKNILTSEDLFFPGTEICAKEKRIKISHSQAR